MRLKYVLIGAPLVFLLILLQSYFWVPTYDSQTVGNANRLKKFIIGSIADAQILNPILNADTSSSQIVDLVFDGLLRLDEDNQLEGRLAESWTITETAYLLVNEGAAFTDGTPVGPEVLAERFRQLMTSPEGRELGRIVENIASEPAKSLPLASVIEIADESIDPALTVRVPPRIVFRLKEVDQDLFKRLAPVTGSYDAEGFDWSSWGALPADKKDAYAAALKERFPVLAHHPEITFKLRRDVKFHDGEAFDAEDVVFTYNAIMDTKNLSPRTSDFEPIERIDVIDRFNVKVVYKRLFSPAINAWTMGILPEHALNPEVLQQEARRTPDAAAAAEAGGMRQSAFNRSPFGTGPFRFQSWQSDEVIHLTRNDDYWDTPPLYQDYFYRVIPDALTQEVEFRTGAVDAYAPAPHQIARYRKDTRYQNVSTVGAGYAYVGYNNRRPLFQDPRARRALGMAIDVDQIITYVLYGEGKRTTGPYPIITPWYDPDVPAVPYDPAGAIKLLESLGWRRNADGWMEKDGKIFEFSLITNNGNAVRKAIVTIAQQSWKQIGVKVNTQVFEWTVFLSEFVDPGDFDAVVLGWSLGADPDLFQLWHSSQSNPKQLNFIGYDNSEADGLIERIRREYDADEQKRLARELHRVIAADQPYTFLMTRLVTVALDRKIVMVKDDGTYEPVRPSKSGSVYYHLNRWTKLEHAFEF